MTPRDREALADVVGRELAAARAAWRKEREIILAETRSTIAELRAEVAELKLVLHEKAKTIKNGEPGPQGPPGAAGQAGRDGIDGKDGAPGAPGTFPLPRAWSDQIHYAGQIVTHDGSTWQARRDTAAEPPGEDWSPIAVKGTDAPVGDVRGTYDAAATYRRFDCVTNNGAEFRARRDNPGPLPGEGWAMSARQGKPGPKGERGERGPPGERGPGVDENRVRRLIAEAIEQYHAEVA